MPKYMSRSSTRKSSSQSAYDRATENQQEEFLRLMRRESEKLLREFRENLERSMREEITNQMKQATQQMGAGINGAIDSGSFAPNIGGLASFVGQAINLFLSKPRYSQSSAESERSLQSLSQFRTSRAESLAELSGTLAQGERNN